MNKKTVFEYQWLQPITNQGTNTTYEPTIEFLTENQANKKGLKICLKETKRVKSNKKNFLTELENIIFLCKVNFKRFESEQYTYSKKETGEILEGLVSPQIEKLLKKYKMRYTNRQYLVYSSKREEKKVLPPNDILNKDNKQASLLYNMSHEMFYLSYESGIVECLKITIGTIKKFIDLFFTTTEEQRQRILSADPDATFPQDDFVNTKLDYYQLEAALLNTKNRIREEYYNVEKPKKQKVTIEPHELSFLPAHGSSTCMIRYKGRYYGYYMSGYVSEQREKGIDVSYSDGLTREQTVEQIKKKQRLGQSFVSDCFPGMNNEQIQDYCMKRLEKLDNTNYTNNFEFHYSDAIKFCHEHGLDDAVKFIVLNFPNREEVKKYMAAREFSFYLPIGDYIREGNLDMVKFFYEQGGEFYAHSYYLVYSAAKENQLEVLKYLFPKFSEKMRLEEVGEDFIQKTADEGHIEVLDYLASQGYFCDAVIESKTRNTRYYDKEMAEVFQNHKVLYQKHKKDQQQKRAIQEQERKRKKLESEKNRKENIINNIGSSNENIKSKIKKLSSDKLEQLERILN